MSLKKTIAKLDVLVGTLTEDERAGLLVGADRAFRGVLEGFAAIKRSIPADRIAAFGKAITDVVTSAMVSYGIAYLSPAKKRPPEETVGLELEKAIVPTVSMPALLGPIATHLASTHGADPEPAAG